MALAKSATLMAALELGWRMQGEINNGKETILNDSESLFKFMSPMMVDLDHEEFWAVYLSNRGKLLGRQRIASGGQTATSVDPRIIFRGALEAKAVKIMVAHNHPSGNLKPSREDRELTHRLSEIGNLMEIKLLEHIIIAIEPNGKAGYYSFHDNGLL
jgi:DNA repair protein RadC